MLPFNPTAGEAKIGRPLRLDDRLVLPNQQAPCSVIDPVSVRWKAIEEDILISKSGLPWRHGHIRVCILTHMQTCILMQYTCTHTCIPSWLRKTNTQNDFFLRYHFIFIACVCMQTCVQFPKKAERVSVAGGRLFVSGRLDPK